MQLDCLFGTFQLFLVCNNVVVCISSVEDIQAIVKQSLDKSAKGFYQISGEIHLAYGHKLFGIAHIVEQLNL